MLTLNAILPDAKLSTFLAIEFAKEALPIWEGANKHDDRPQRSLDTVNEIYGDLSAAGGYDRAYDAYNSAVQATFSAKSKASLSSAYSVAYAAYTAAHAAAHERDKLFGSTNVNARYNLSINLRTSADFASEALFEVSYKFVDRIVKKNLDHILDYNIANSRGFGDSEKVLESLSDLQKEKFLFNIEVLR
jgi:hypothetical protein